MRHLLTNLLTYRRPLDHMYALFEKYKMNLNKWSRSHLFAKTPNNHHQDQTSCRRNLWWFPSCLVLVLVSRPVVLAGGRGLSNEILALIWVTKLFALNYSFTQRAQGILVHFFSGQQSKLVWPQQQWEYKNWALATFGRNHAEGIKGELGWTKEVTC